MERPKSLINAANMPKLADLIKRPVGADVMPIRPPSATFEAIYRRPVDGNLASEFYERLKSMVQKFDRALDEEHEVGVRLVSFGQTVTFHLEDIGYWNPSLMTFSGVTADGEPVQLIQHVSQISILLMKMQRRDPSQPKRPIGFCRVGDPDCQESCDSAETDSPSP